MVEPRTSEPVTLVDTSVAVAFLTVDHASHEQTFEPLANRRLGLAGHAAFETFSVMTRLPAPARRTSATVARLLSCNFPETRFLTPSATADLLQALDRLGIAGGAVYDALVGAVAVEHGLTLATRDRRATDVYRALGVRLEAIF